MPRHQPGKSPLVVCLAIATLAGAALRSAAPVPTTPAAVQSPPASSTPQEPSPPVFRGGVNFVNVDAYPRRDGHVVEGLRAEDFQVLEDGKPQKVETFEFIRTEPNAVDSDRRDPNSDEDSNRQAADPRNRVFVVYLDIFHTTFNGARDTRRPLLDFLGRTIGPTDLFGVLTPQVPVRQLVFGRRLETLEGDLTTYWGQSGPHPFPQTAEEERLIGCGGPIKLYRDDLMYSSLEELMVRLRVLRDERKNVLLITEEGLSRAAPGSGGRGGGTMPRLPPIGVGPGGRLGLDTPTLGQRDDAWCARQAARLSSIDFDQRFRDLLDLARRSNVSFYPIDVGGLRTFAITASARNGRGASNMMRAGLAKIDSLITLADNTDGRAIVNTNDLNAGFRRIADDLSAYYLLGYSSTNTSLDGKFHKIDVKVNQPKVSVTARKGYLAPTAAASVPANVAPAAAMTPSPMVEELGRLARLRPDAELFTYGVAASDGLDIVAEIASREIDLGHWSMGADVQVTVARDGRADLTAVGRIEAGVRATLVHVPFAATEPGLWRISVRLSRADDAIANRVEIPAASDGLIGAPLCFRGTSSARVPLRPVADFQFRRTERVHVEWPVMKALDQRTARVLDRNGQPLALAATVTESAGAIASGGRGAPLVIGRTVVAVDLNLAPLSEGDYGIELTAGQGAQTDRRVVAFRVVR